MFERHFDSLYGFFANKVDAGVDDLVQQTLLACVEGKMKIRDGASFRAYMFAIAQRVLIAHLRRKYANVFVDETVTSVCDLSPSPSQVAAERAEQQLVLEALRQLPLETQIVLEMYYMQGLRGSELADALDVPEPTARTRIRRGLIKLRQLVDARLTDPALRQRCGDGDLETWAASLAELAGG